MSPSLFWSQNGLAHDEVPSSVKCNLVTFRQKRVQNKVALTLYVHFYNTYTNVLWWCRCFQIHFDPYFIQRGNIKCVQTNEMTESDGYMYAYDY